MKLVVLVEGKVEENLDPIGQSQAKLWIPSRIRKDHTDVYDVLILTDESTEPSQLECALRRLHAADDSKRLKIANLEKGIAKFHDICNAVGGENMLFDVVHKFLISQKEAQKQAADAEKHSTFIRRLKP